MNIDKLKSLQLDKSSIETWSVPMWNILHKQAKRNPYQKDWLDVFENKIPCPECKTHFKDFRKNNEPNTKFFKWTVDLHNSVNEKIGKKKYPYASALSQY